MCAPAGSRTRVLLARDAPAAELAATTRGSGGNLFPAVARRAKVSLMPFALRTLPASPSQPGRRQSIRPPPAAGDRRPSCGYLRPCFGRRNNRRAGFVSSGDRGSSKRPEPRGRTSRTGTAAVSAPPPMTGARLIDSGARLHLWSRAGRAQVLTPGAPRARWLPRDSALGSIRWTGRRFARARPAGGAQRSRSAR